MRPNVASPELLLGSLKRSFDSVISKRGSIQIVICLWFQPFAKRHRNFLPLVAADGILIHPDGAELIPLSLRMIGLLQFSGG